MHVYVCVYGCVCMSVCVCMGIYVDERALVYGLCVCADSYNLINICAQLQGLTQLKQTGRMAYLNTACSIALSLTKLFNLSLTIGTIPVQGRRLWLSQFLKALTTQSPH